MGCGSVKKVKGGFHVTGGAKRTTKAKAVRQSRLLRAISHGFKPK